MKPLVDDDTALELIDALEECARMLHFRANPRDTRAQAVYGRCMALLKRIEETA